MLQPMNVVRAGGALNAYQINVTWICTADYLWPAILTTAVRVSKEWDRRFQHGMAGGSNVWAKTLSVVVHSEPKFFVETIVFLPPCDEVWAEADDVGGAPLYD